MNIGIHFKSIILGFLTIIIAATLGTLYVWLEALPMEPSGRTGHQLFLLLFAPAIAGMCLYFIGRGLYRVLMGATRFTVTTRNLMVRGPLRTRVFPWNSIQDFLLPPGSFPKSPESLALLFTQGRQVKLLLPRFRAVGAEAMLTASVPGLAEWGLERVRTAKPTTTSPLRVRWQLHKSSLFSLYGMPVLFLFVTLGSVAISWEFVNYMRISQSHRSATAQITEITKESGKHETVWARVRYTALNGQCLRLHRQVMVDFADQFKVGDQVTVDYLPNHPNIGRIPGWDLDDRQWVMLILILPVVWVTYRGTQRSAANWFRPLRERMAWAAKSSSPHFAFSGANLETLYALLPDKHRGSIILKPPPSNSKKPGLRTWSRWFKRSGIQARQALGKFLILAPDQAKRMLNRIGGDNSFVGGYMVLDCVSADEAERIVLDQMAKVQSEAGNTSLEHVRLYWLDRAIGPLDDSQRLAVFQTWTTQRLRRLYGGMTPPEIPEVDFAGLFNIDPANGVYDLLIERRKPGPRVWLRDDQGSHARLAECTRGRWLVIDNVPMPSILKSRRARRILFS